MSPEPRRLSWWRLYALIVVGIVVVSAVMLRYDFLPTSPNSVYFVRVDRWTGKATLGYFNVDADGRWVAGRRPQ